LRTYLSEKQAAINASSDDTSTRDDSSSSISSVTVPGNSPPRFQGRSSGRTQVPTVGDRDSQIHRQPIPIYTEEAMPGAFRFPIPRQHVRRQLQETQGQVQPEDPSGGDSQSGSTASALRQDYWMGLGRTARGTLPQADPPVEGVFENPVSRRNRPIPSIPGSHRTRSAGTPSPGIPSPTLVTRQPPALEGIHDTTSSFASFDPSSLTHFSDGMFTTERRVRRGSVDIATGGMAGMLLSRETTALGQAATRDASDWRQIVGASEGYDSLALQGEELLRGSMGGAAEPSSKEYPYPHERRETQDETGLEVPGISDSRARREPDQQVGTRYSDRGTGRLRALAGLVWSGGSGSERKCNDEEPRSQ
jgi:hypothetical protein